MFKRLEMGFDVPLGGGSDYMNLHEMAEEISKLIPNGRVSIESVKSSFCMVRVEVDYNQPTD